MRTLGMRPWFGKTVAVANAAAVFDGSGALVDEKLRDQLSAYMAGFADFIADQKRSKSPSI